ncbi:MAG: peptidoglycan -binding protein [Stellaceae bacterium]
MPLQSRNPRRSSIDIWPGFVDALSQLLMIIIFLLLIFTVGQFYLSDALSGRDQALKKLQRQIDNLADLLALERQSNSALRHQAAAAAAQLAATLAERDRLKAQAAALTVRTKTAEAALAGEKGISSKALAQVALLNQQIAALRDQLSQIAAALDIANTKVKQQQTQIVDLGKRLNLALANKVQELARYRSEFFGQLRQILGNRPDIRIVGDRFVFQSEVLFAPGSAELTDSAKKELEQVFTALKQIATRIPPDLKWILQVDGFTDSRPIHTAQFPSNWELSAARAISVVRFAIAQGIPPQRVSAEGFGDKQPIALGNTPAAYRLNRRIELKLTER